MPAFSAWKFAAFHWCKSHMHASVPERQSRLRVVMSECMMLCVFCIMYVSCGLLSAHIRRCVSAACVLYILRKRAVCVCVFAVVAGEMICALHNGPTCCVLQRWQRRWFVLYDDGEFTYSVDEHVSVKQSSACGRGAQTKRRPEQTPRLAFVFFVIRKW
jgi:hypothetical protein